MEQVAPSALQEEEYLALQTAQIILAVSDSEVSTQEKITVPVRSEEISHLSNISASE